MPKGKKTEKIVEPTIEVETEEVISEEVTPEVVETVVTEDAEILALKAQVEQLKANAATKEALEAEIKDLKASEDRTGGKTIVLEKAIYKFRNIEDPGQNFNGTFSHPITEGGRNHRTRYSFDDGAEVELPVKFAKQLNKCEYPKNKLALDSNGNKMINKGFHTRWVFTKVE